MSIASTASTAAKPASLANLHLLVSASSPERKVIETVASGLSSASAALPTGWTFKSELSRNDGKLELLDLKGSRKGVAFVNPRVNNLSIARLTGINIASDKRALGLGKKLFAQVEQEVASLGFTAIEAHPLRGAEGFYAQAGYRQADASSAGGWIKPLQAP